MSLKKTNITNVKEIAKAFLYLEPQVIESIPMFVDHPYFSSRVTMTKSGELVDIIDNPDTLEKVRKDILETLDKGDLITPFCLIQEKYHLVFLKYIKQYLSKEDFSRRLAEAWITSENPNQDINVSINEFIRWFKQADRNSLMKPEELKYYNKLPNEVKIYRGVAVGRAEQQGLSWTCNFKTAKWFSERFNHSNQKGYILSGKVKKEDIFAYFNGRNEDEILCNSKKVYDITRIE